MQFLAKLLDLLERLGVNTTRWRWKLYSFEKKAQSGGLTPKVPTRLHWLKYPHKHCMKCGALNDGADSTCRKCGVRLPSVLVYRLYRLFGVIAPEGSPVVVGAFVGLIGFFFVLCIAMQGMSALMSPNRLTLAIMGAWNPGLVAGGTEIWRYLSFGLLHFGILHIGFNSYALMQVGPLVENLIGRARMLVLITFTQLTSALATLIWYVNVRGNLNVFTVGASGWLFGLIGFGIAHLRFHGGAQAYRNALIQWAIYALLFGLLFGANNAAHVGGLIGGAILGSLPEPRRQYAKPVDAAWNTAAALSAGLWILTLACMVYSTATHWNAGET